jgi:hemoglobin
MHGPELTEIRKVFKNHLTEWTGGPARYSAVKGQLRLRQRHLPFPIGNAARGAWMACMTQALDDTLGDTPARRELEGNISRLADWMRSRADARSPGGWRLSLMRTPVSLARR